MEFNYGEQLNHQSGEIIELLWVGNGDLLDMAAVLERHASLSLTQRQHGQKRA